MSVSQFVCFPPCVPSSPLTISVWSKRERDQPGDHELAFLYFRWYNLTFGGVGAMTVWSRKGVFYLQPFLSSTLFSAVQL